MTSIMELSEEDIKNRYISPAIFETAGWDKRDSRKNDIVLMHRR